MKANELMIGDIVMSYDVPFRVKGLNPESDEPVCLGMEKEDVWTTESEVFGVRLTPQILEKNGIPTNGDTYYFGVDNKYVGVPELCYYGGKLNWTISCCEYEILTFNYVHELQHALRICGLTELADNFKI